MKKFEPEPFDPEQCTEIIYLKNKFQEYRDTIYDVCFFEEVSKSFNVTPENKEDFEISILAAAEIYERLHACNENIEPVYKAQNRISSLQKSLVSLKDDLDNLLQSPEATIDEFIINLYAALDEKDNQNFADYLHERHIKNNIHSNHLVVVSEIIEALFSATEYYPEGIHITKNDPFQAWLSRIAELFEQYSDISFTQGKYYTDKDSNGQPIGYISECVEILYRMHAPLDPTITKKKLGYRIQQYNRYRAR